MPASKKKTSDSGAKPKSLHKRRKASINFNPKSSTKRKVTPNKNKEDDMDNDFIDQVNDKTTKYEENESGVSSDEEISRINEISQNNQTNILGSGIQRTISHRKTSVTSQDNTLSTLSSTRSGASQFAGISPGNPVENNLENEGGFQVQTDKSFIQQQVQLLTTAFTLQDCPGLAGKQDRRHNSIPYDVIHDVLRKLQHKMDDEIQKHLNRQSQRKVLSDLLEIEIGKAVNEKQDDENRVKETMAVSEILEKCSNELDKNDDADSNLLRKYSDSIAELRTLNDEMKKIQQEIAMYKSNNLLVLEVESLAREKTGRSLQKEIERTKKLVNQVARVLRDKANSA